MNIPIRIQPAFFLVAILIGYLSTMSFAGVAVWVAIITVSVLVHEFGHALTAIFFGQQASIELVAFGGLTRHDGKRLKPWQDFLIVLNGPMAGFLLAFVAYLGAKSVPQEGPYDEILYILFAVNVFWTVVNLLPIHPMDGGKLLTIILEKIMGHRGVKVSYFISFIFGAIVALAFFYFGLFLAGALLFLLAFEAFRAWQGVRKMGASDRDHGLQEMLEEARNHLDQGLFSQAEKELKAILVASKEGIIHTTAQQMLAMSLGEQGKKLEAFELLLPIREDLDPEVLLYFQKLAAELGAWEEALAAGKEVYQLIPNPETALINASAHAVRGDQAGAVGWIHRARQDGGDVDEWLLRPEFDGFRD